MRHEESSLPAVVCQIDTNTSTVGNHTNLQDKLDKTEFHYTNNYINTVDGFTTMVSPHSFSQVLLKYQLNI